MSRSIILRAKYFEDCECIEICHLRYIGEGIGMSRLTDYIYSRPIGDWHDIKFSKKEAMYYTTFLDTMVVKNIDVARKLARIVSTVNDAWSTNDKLASMHAIRILDPTFTPPYINLKCRWQRELLNEIIGDTTLSIISTCRNMERLDYYYDAMR